MKKLFLLLFLFVFSLVNGQTTRDSVLCDIQSEDWVIIKDTDKQLKWKDKECDLSATAYFDKQQNLKKVVWHFYDRNYYLIVFYHIFKCQDLVIKDKNDFICQGKLYKVKIKKHYLYIKKSEQKL